MLIQPFFKLGRKLTGSLSTLVTPPFLATHRDKIAGGVEQLLSSLTSMVGLILLSRMMDINSFGIVAMAIGVWLIVEMIQHSVTINPFILLCSHPAEDRKGFGAWILWNLFFAMMLSGVFMLVAMLLWPYQPDFAQGLLLSGPLCFTGMLYMFLRRLHYHRMHRTALLTQTSLYAVSYLGGISFLFLQGITPTPFQGNLVQIVAFALPALVMSYPAFREATFRLNGLRNIWRARKLISEMGTAGFLWQLPYTITLLALSIFSIPAEVAIFTVTRTLVRPITLVMATINDVEFSKASRAFVTEGAAGLARVVQRARKALWLLNSIPIVLLVLFPGFLLSLVYGEQYADATLELRLRTFLFLPLIHLAPLEMGLTIFRETRYLLHVFLFSLVGCLAYLVLVYMHGTLDAASALASLVFARIIVIPFLHWRYSSKTANIQSHESDLGDPKPYA